MTRRLIVLVALFMPSLAVAQRAPVTAPASATATAPAATAAPLLRGMRVTRDVTMRLYLPAGRLRLTTWARDSVAVRGTIGPTGSLFGGGSATHVKFGIEPRTPGDVALPSGDLEVTVPRAARLWVKMIDGTIDARGTSGELELYTVRGAIVVRDVSGVCSIESIDAPITLTQARGDLRLRGSRGRVEATDVQGTLSIATVSGPVVLQRISADGRVETIGGAITLTAPALDGRTLELQSHAGDITLALDPSRAPLLDLSSRAGPAIGERLTGASQFGRLSARSFKGHIAVRALR